MTSHPTYPFLCTRLDMWLACSCIACVVQLNRQLSCPLDSRSTEVRSRFLTIKVSWKNHHQRLSSPHEPRSRVSSTHGHRPSNLRPFLPLHAGFVISRGWPLYAVKNHCGHLGGALRPLWFFNIPDRVPTGFTVIRTLHVDDFEVA